MKKWKVSTVYCLFVTIAVFCVLYLAIDRTVTNATKKVGNTYVEDMSDVLLNSFNVTMRMRMDEVRGLSTVLQGNESTKSARLSYMARQYGFTHLALYEDSECKMLYGEEICAVDAEQFNSMLSGGQECLVLGVEGDGDFVMMCAIPTRIGNVKGIVAALPIEYIEIALSSNHTRLASYSVIKDDGRAILNSAGRLTQGMLDDMALGKDFIVDTTENGVRSSNYYYKLPFTRWYLVVSMDISYFDAIESHISRVNIGVFFIGLIMILAVVLNLFIKYYRVLKDQAERIKSASDAKSVFLRNMSHDIRTPLNGIIGAAKIADGDITNADKVRDCLNTITVSGNYLLGLFDNMLDIAAIENGKVVLHNTPMWVGDLVCDVERTINFSIMSKRQTLSVFVTEDVHDYINCDKSKLSQLLLSLLSNAVKFTPDNGIIKLTISALGDSVQLVVEDTGIGIKEESLPKVFDMFWRENELHDEAESGIGIGLFICKSIVDAMCGEITVYSEVGIGTAVTVILPVEMLQYRHEGDLVVYADDNSVATRLSSVGYELTDDADKADVVIMEGASTKPVVHMSEIRRSYLLSSLVHAIDNARVEEPVELNLSGSHILVAEDNELNYEIISALLEDFDLVVDRAEDGAVCVRKFSESEVGYYSRIIMDIRMPNMNGYEAARAIRELARADAKTVPIIAMSADAYAAAVEECMKSGMNAFTSKPVNIDEVIELLRKGGY